MMNENACEAGAVGMIRHCLNRPGRDPNAASSSDKRMMQRMNTKTFRSRVNKKGITFKERQNALQCFGVFMLLDKIKNSGKRRMNMIISRATTLFINTHGKQRHRFLVRDNLVL